MNKMNEQRQKLKRWIHRGNIAVEVEVEAIFPPDSPEEECLEPSTVRYLDEIAQHVEAEDLPYLKNVGKVFIAVPA